MRIGCKTARWNMFLTRWEYRKESSTLQSLLGSSGEFSLSSEKVATFNHLEKWEQMCIKNFISQLFFVWYGSVAHNSPQDRIDIKSQDMISVRAKWYRFGYEPTRHFGYEPTDNLIFCQFLHICFKNYSRSTSLTKNIFDLWFPQTYWSFGACRTLGPKGSNLHKAIVIGDPLKDTSGPSLMAVESLVFAPFFATHPLEMALDKRDVQTKAIAFFFEKLRSCVID
jgi:hypothetical protein